MEFVSWKCSSYMSVLVDISHARMNVNRNGLYMDGLNKRQGMTKYTILSLANYVLFDILQLPKMEFSVEIVLLKTQFIRYITKFVVSKPKLF